MARDSERRDIGNGRCVTIDSQFVRDEARDAVRQFFRPITAPFETVRMERSRPEPARRTRPDTKRR